MSKSNEVYRLKLMNQELREDLQAARADYGRHLSQDKVDALLQDINQDQNLLNMLSQDSMDLLNKMQDLSPNLRQLLEHQEALYQLFSTSDYSQVNRNCAEINQKCLMYLDSVEAREEEQKIHIQPHQQYNDFTI